MTNSDIQKPCVVQTPQGFSVSYNNHLLYSKYNPSKLIIQTIENQNLLPGSIILCISPVLEYGIKELLNKLPEECLIILCESDKLLYDFSYSNVLEKLPEVFQSETPLMYPKPDELNNLPVKLFNLSSSGRYKRVIRIDFSAGAQLYSDYYKELEAACINAVATFWKNRITLTKFGRKYSFNFFRNLSNLDKTTPITNYFQAVSKPIIVFGAGQSVDLFFKNNNLDFSKFFILCADTALQPLLHRSIVPDGVFVEEAQSVITKAFIGAYKNIHLFAGLSSLPNLSRFIKLENISYFTTEYINANFLKKLYDSDFLPPVNPPFGSVGITAVYYALKFRKNQNIPVYFCGLDFSYSAGFTHAKGTLSHSLRIQNTNKLIPIDNLGAFYAPSTIKLLDKNNSSVVTTPTLKAYAQLFTSLFTSTPNLYDAGDCGISLGIIQAHPLAETSNIQDSIQNTIFSENQIHNLKSYLKEEKEALIYLKKLLTEKTDFSTEELQSEIKKIAAEREYLFLHFPDGYSFNYSQSFLNRIRTEIDFFLKWITT